ncbi:MAG: ribosome biogenesis GTP-binding protein YihA/YsxC [Chromatiales bacterium]|nr:ribosome biogenesis GTP-binding protein YihA/YsxC [Chromatiales bacterium]
MTQAERKPDSAAPYRNAQFVHGTAYGGGLPADGGLEVAFAGRSNSGKSSSINTITGRRALARTSKTPGRTQQINFFDLGDERRLVDLPGYGYAQVSEETRRRWRPLIESYLNGRRSLAGMILTVDCRREPDDLDAILIDWCLETGVPLHLLLTKSDKLTRNVGAQALRRWRERLAAPDDGEAPAASVQLFSSLSRDGVEEARARLAEWLEFGQKKAPALGKA